MQAFGGKKLGGIQISGCAGGAQRDYEVEVTLSYDELLGLAAKVLEVEAKRADDAWEMIGPKIYELLQDQLDQDQFDSELEVEREVKWEIYKLRSFPFYVDELGGKPIDSEGEMPVFDDEEDSGAECGPGAQ